MRFLGKTEDRKDRRGESGRERAEGSQSERLVTVRQPSSVATEAYRTLRTNLIYAQADEPPRVIVVTSPGPGEGKSTTCCNLGVVMTQAGKRTLIIDCDFRKPVVHTFFELRNLHGIVDVLVGERSLQEVWHEPLEGLKAVTVGPLPLNPAEVLGSRRFSEFVAGVREDFDYVLLDASPVGLVSDPAIIATQGDGVLLVLDAQRTRKVAVRQSVRSLNAVGANIIGTVMNNVRLTKSAYHYYQDYYIYK